MGTPLDTLTIRGFKSIRALEDFKLKNLNIIIGANGAGKSNFVEFFRVLFAMLKKGGLSEHIRGVADVYLFGGPKVTKKITAKLDFGGYYTTSIELLPNDNGDLYAISSRNCSNWDAALASNNEDNFIPWAFEPLAENGTVIIETDKEIPNPTAFWKIYHFHDTTKEAGMRRYHDQGHNEKLFEDASNIAPFLMRLRDEHSHEYNEILNAVRLVIPFFDDFILKPDTNENVRLNWRQKGLNDYPMRPSQLSDGSIRFICLATALLQPNPPSTIIIDEPELGLHPEAIALLAELIQSAALRTQVIVATQSPALIDYFAIEDIVVVNRKDGASTFERLKEEDFSEWLKDYSVGELWRKNVIAGGTVHE